MGGMAWALGYVLTYLIVAPDIRQSPLNRLIEIFGGDPATFEMVGWVYYNAHLVPTVFQNVPIFGGRTASFIGGDNGFTVLLYVIPVGLLIAGGIAVARYQGASTANDGLLAALTVVPAYLLLSIAGVLLTTVTVGDVSGSPDILLGIVLAGAVYPSLCAGVGAMVAVLT